VLKPSENTPFTALQLAKLTLGLRGVCVRVCVCVSIIARRQQLWLHPALSVLKSCGRCSCRDRLPHHCDVLVHRRRVVAARCLQRHYRHGCCGRCSSVGTQGYGAPAAHTLLLRLCCARRTTMPRRRRCVKDRVHGIGTYGIQDHARVCRRHPQGVT
jgi:hypothetical protein